MFVIILCFTSHIFAMNDIDLSNEIRHKILLSCITIADSPFCALLIHARLAQVNTFWRDFIKCYKNQQPLPIAATGDDNPTQIPTAEVISVFYEKFKNHSNFHCCKLSCFWGTTSIDWIDKFIDFSCKDSFYRKCLFEAFDCSYEPLIHWLDLKHFNYYQKDENKWFPIVHAIQLKNKKVTHFLLDKANEEHLSTLITIKDELNNVQEKTLLTLIFEWGDLELRGLASGKFKRHKPIREAQKSDTTSL